MNWINRSFWITLLLMVILFFLPGLLSAGAPAWDGQQVHGFPLVYAYYGGLCFDPDMEEGVTCRGFRPENLVIDLSLLVVIPLITGRISHARRQRSNQN